MRSFALFYILMLFCVLPCDLVQAEEPLPVGSNPLPIGTPHFPDRVHAFVWRNWELVDAEHLAKVLGTSSEKVVDVAVSMGLPHVAAVPPEMRQRGFITLVRRNWHLLPYNQLLELLEMSSEELAYALREDDFLFYKLGGLKPKCEPLVYHEPDAQARKRAAEIKQVVKKYFGDQLKQPAEPRFHFVKQLSQIDESEKKRKQAANSSSEGPRFIHSYFALFGDSLINPELDPYPDGLLSRLAEVGVNGVWLHVVLRQLAPGGEEFPEFGSGHEQRLENLRRLVDRAKRYGIDIYLYINEPRSQPVAFFEERPEMAGVQEGDYVAMCTSDPQVRKWLTDSLAHVFREVPDLGGILTITASENLTNCTSHFGQEKCPRCSSRSVAEVLAEVNAAMEEGVHRSNPDARVIVWDWGWNRHGEAPETIALLPKSVWLMSVSEWAKPFVRGGVHSKVGEYSISVVGPGPRAKKHWAWAKEAGLKTVAKVQLNNTWELSSVPFLPVLDLIAEHCKNLEDAEVDGTMLSWSLGGYPSMNLEVAHRFATTQGASVDSVLDAIASHRYGATAAPHARSAWTAFSNAFRQFPYSGNVLYQGPQQMGPANLLYGEPTGYRATMVCFPYDVVGGWCPPYTPVILAEQFDKMAMLWAAGLVHMERAAKLAPENLRATTEADLRVARAAYLHFASSANQTRFVLARDALGQPDVSPEKRQKLRSQIQSLIDQEISHAQELFTITQLDSRIGFESSNQYYYVPLDLVEKVVNCEFIGQHLDARD